MNHRERIQACLSGDPVDRPPVSLWRHFPVDDQDPRRLAAATVQFQRTFDFDFVKVTPSSSFCLKDWGSEDEWRGAREGTRSYTRRVIQEPQDWLDLPLLDPRKGHLADQLGGLRLIVEDLGPDVPVVQTIFSPLAQAKNLAGPERMLVHLRRHPRELHRGLEVIAEGIRRFISAALGTGVAGIFYAVQHAKYNVLSESEYRAFGRIYDLQILESASSMWLNVLHLHGDQVMFGLFADYPVAVFNWHDRETPPSLQDALARVPGVVCGGLRRWETIVLNTPEAVRAEARESIAATGGRRFILGTGCVTPTTAPYGNLMAARRSVEEQ